MNFTNAIVINVESAEIYSIIAYLIIAIVSVISYLIYCRCCCLNINFICLCIYTCSTCACCDSYFDDDDNTKIIVIGLPSVKVMSVV